jgi:hypothetical protein
MRKIVPSLVWALVLVVGATAGTAWAAPAAGNCKKGGKSAAQAAEVKAFAPVVTELRQIQQLLELADHDYKGHRAKAVTELGHAIAALPHHHVKGGKPIKGGGEPQALSDAQLREAFKALGVIEAQLATVSNPHAVKALTHVNNAAKHLEVALTIK